MRPILKKNATCRHITSHVLCLYVAFFYKIVIMCGAGDARKIVTFVPNCHYLEQKFSFLFKTHFLVRAHQTTTTKLLRIRPTMATLIWPNATTTQQSRGTSLTSKIIANSLRNFILVDCYLATFSRIW
jgi:hypothetical protein